VSKYVTEALTAQAVETPCTPLAAAFPTQDLAFCFAVDVTEMAELGPEQYPLPYARALVACQESLACTCIGAIRYACYPQRVFEHGCPLVTPNGVVHRRKKC
jgi:hypothetical protein